MFTTLTQAFTALANAVRGKLDTSDTFTPEEAINEVSGLMYDKRRNYIGGIKPYLRGWGSETTDDTPTMLFEDFDKYLRDHRDTAKSTSENFDDYLSAYPQGYDIDTTFEDEVIRYQRQREAIVRPYGTPQAGKTVPASDCTLMTHLGIDVGAIADTSNTYPSDDDVNIIQGLFIRGAYMLFFPLSYYNKVVFNGNGYDPTTGGTYSTPYAAGNSLFNFAGSNDSKLFENFAMRYSNRLENIALYISSYQYLWAAIHDDIAGGRIGFNILLNGYAPYTMLDIPILGVADSISTPASDVFVKARSLSNAFKREVSSPYAVLEEFVPTSEEAAVLEIIGQTGYGAAFPVLTNPTNDATTMVYMDYTGKNAIMDTPFPVSKDVSTFYGYLNGGEELIAPYARKYDATAADMDHLYTPATQKILIEGVVSDSYLRIYNVHMDHVLNSTDVFLQINDTKKFDQGYLANEISSNYHLTLYLKAVEEISGYLFAYQTYDADTIILGGNLAKIAGFAQSANVVNNASATKKVYFTSNTPPQITGAEIGSGTVVANANISVYCPSGTLSAYAAVFPQLYAAGILAEGSPSFVELTEADIKRIGESLTE